MITWAAYYRVCAALHGLYGCNRVFIQSAYWYRTGRNWECFG